MFFKQGNNYHDDFAIAYTRWGADRALKKMKKKHIQMARMGIPKIVFEEKSGRRVMDA